MMVTLDTGTCGWPSRTTSPEVASINFIGLCAPLALRALAGRYGKTPHVGPVNSWSRAVLLLDGTSRVREMARRSGRQVQSRQVQRRGSLELVRFAVAVDVMPKDGISDPQGQTIERAL